MVNMRSHFPVLWPIFRVLAIALAINFFAVVIFFGGASVFEGKLICPNLHASFSCSFSKFFVDAYWVVLLVNFILWGAPIAVSVGIVLIVGYLRRHFTKNKHIVL